MTLHDPALARRCAGSLPPPLKLRRERRSAFGAKAGRSRCLFVLAALSRRRDASFASCSSTVRSTWTSPASRAALR